MERFLYRLAQSKYQDQFVLKGALIFLAWGAPLSRPTRDIDLLGLTDNAVEHLITVVKEICQQPVESDGVVYDSSSVFGETIKEGTDYEGVRIRLLGLLGNARAKIQIDIGFADAISPGPIPLIYPTLLDMPSPKLLGYSRESVIAEKLQAMVYLGSINSRMKDFYDVWILSRQFIFDGVTLQK
ncbi:MAG: nucleotidyl transferase AbiEii/AbiGii toxin family protein, partial [Anaerolineaceae bacterium]|nr:nucleotidyl transferase AbiEii/AbiGii toxin family protein [Anaerolineaceae bacterium]